MEKNTMKNRLNYKPNIGVIGCGSVCEMYLDFLSRKKEINIYACSDLNKSLAENTAKKYGIKKVMSTNDIISDNKIDVILNLTNPVNHFAINLKALLNKKSVFSEKPFALKYSDALKLANLAKREKRMLCSAPDTYFSKGMQTARIFLEKGTIGKLLGATVISSCLPIENWHPNPEFFYKNGAGPLYDRGVYYITILVFLFGSITSVSSYCDSFIVKRIFPQNSKVKKIINVKTPTHYTVIIKFKDGQQATLLLSYDVKVIPNEMNVLQVFGTKGAVKLPDPMQYNGNAQYYNFKKKLWCEIKNLNRGFDLAGDIRGVSLLDMVKRYNNKNYSSENIEVATHVIEVMNAIDKSCKTSRHINISSTCRKHKLINK